MHAEPATPHVSAEVAQRLADLADQEVAQHPEKFAMLHDELAQRLNATED